MPYKDKKKGKENLKKYYQKNKNKIILRSAKRYKEKNDEIKLKSKEYYERTKKLTGEGNGHRKGVEFKKGQIPWNKGLGNPSENHRIRTSLEYILWRKACFERDSFTCQISGEHGGELVVHHINNFADFPELRTSLNNGITMTKKIHKAFHKKYGNKNNTEEQLIKFSEDFMFNPSNNYYTHT